LDRAGIQFPWTPSFTIQLKKRRALLSSYLAAPLLKNMQQTTNCPRHGLVLVRPPNSSNVDVDRAALEILSAMIVSTIEINRCLQSVTATNSALRKAIQTPAGFAQAVNG
jgi:hypothetical protein